MIITTLKAILLLIFGTVLFQDMKERQVYWFLFPLIGIIAGILYYKNTLAELFLASVIINALFVLILISLVFLYASFKLKKNPFKTIGLGDLLLFIGLTTSFSTIPFIVLFVSSLIFSLLLHVIIKTNSKNPTVPLAGYMSLFFMLTYISFWTGIIDSLYLL